MKRKLIFCSLLFMLTLCISTNAGAKTIYMQKNASYKRNQLINGKVKDIKYDKKYFKRKKGKLIPQKSGKTTVVFTTKAKKEKITVNIVPKVGFGVGAKVTRDVGYRINLDFTAKTGVTYTSSNKSVAKVSEKGILTMRKRGKATVKAKYLGKTYTGQISCRAPLVGKIFKPDLSQITSIRIRISDGSNEHLCTEQEFQAITDLFSGKAWYYYVETPTEEKEKMSRVISMYDAAGNEEIRIEVDSKSDRIRVENDGPYKTPAGFTLPEFIKNIK